MILPMEFEKFADIFTGSAILGYLLIGALNALITFLISYKFFQTFQQQGYKGKEYFNWLRRKDNIYMTRLTNLTLLSVLGFFLVESAFSFLDTWFSPYLGFITYIIFLFVYWSGNKKKKNKIPLVMTKRMIRLTITYSLLVIISNVIVITVVNMISFVIKDNLLKQFRYCILCVAPIFVPYLVLIAYYINNPYEKHSAKKHILKAKEKLEKFDRVIKIGITGSFGKTSTKEILKTILSEKYKVLATPNSYNTPLGISKTVKRLDETYDVFIAEMGARHEGDIMELADMVKPTRAVITGITAQHLETFGTLAAIKKTKFELIESMISGAAIFSVDNASSLELMAKCKVIAVGAGIDKSKNPKVYADNIVTKNDGTSFILHIDDKQINCNTVLLGKHNVTNICLAAAVCDSLNMDISEIAAGISRVQPVKHRLELINKNGITVLDDSYNANPEGVKCALSVLKDMQGKKIVVTPGMVELGIFENQENYIFGEELSKVADLCILVGRAGAMGIREGLLTNGYDAEKIIMVKDLSMAEEELKKVASSGDTVLFENDLPDKYD